MEISDCVIESFNQNIRFFGCWRFAFFQQAKHKGKERQQVQQ
ncbi:hypothetical protein F441_01790 [Phytophthora nicotianae CJ01A1]|uniref:Uncharacterized protein n=3 Tax=Phytophthora nicotianae TaxID=4792 RepID=W2JSD8_PHYNI|nr:hypothetical protein L915_01749 [Phytophthora nicotianae]ETL48707.1 hypothetical protein L916_01714 [Phytophthora nicotianae]ETO84243.1 hypothetical protein F444_01831 [Phytophthora nicotianae P1976]ETP25319.1 hypothetical protein F441_01790 [Phytophthora nicotianae CJ01A1]